MPPRRKPARRAAGVDLAAMGLKIWNALKDNTVGYILHIRQNGTLVYVGVWNWAQTPADAAKGWTEDTRMHLASVSKFLTAVGTVRLLDSKSSPYDTKIINYRRHTGAKDPTSTRSRPPPVHAQVRLRHRWFGDRLRDDEVESGGGSGRCGELRLREHELRPVPAAHRDRQRRRREEYDLRTLVPERRVLGSQHAQCLPVVPAGESLHAERRRQRRLRAARLHTRRAGRIPFPSARPRAGTPAI